MAGPLHDAARNGDVALLKKLIAEGAAPEERDETGATPLIVAARAGKTDMVEYLVVWQRVQVMARDSHGMTALHASAAANDLMGTEYLVYRGLADMDDTSTEEGITPLMVAAKANSGLVAAYLISYGADVDIVDHAGVTAINWAAKAGNDQIVTMLLTVGATCDHVDPDWADACAKRKAEVRP